MKPKSEVKPHSSLPFSFSVQYATPLPELLFARSTLRRWASRALLCDYAMQITLRFVDEIEGRELNQSFRQKDYATNVLTYEYGAIDTIKVGRKTLPVHAADIVLCWPVLCTEAKAQNKTISHHVAHLLIHGVLHAQGYDHEEETQASQMECIETALLLSLRMPDPYLDADLDENLGAL